MNDKILNSNHHTPHQGEGAKPTTFDLGPMTPRPETKAVSEIAVKDSTTESFVADVIEPSNHCPVIVLFWVPHDPSCVRFSTLLETLVKRAGGLVKLVRLNIEAAPQLAQQMRIQSAPTVFSFQDGRPIDAFAGIQGEAQIQAFLDKLIGDAKPPLEQAMIQAADLLKDDQGAKAEDIYMQILAQDSEYLPAFAGMIRAISAQDEFDRAQDIVDGLDAKTRRSSDIEQAVAALDLARDAALTDTSKIDELLAKIDASPKDLESRFALAQALFAAQDMTRAIDQLLEIVRQDRTWHDDAGRKQLIKIFDALGHADPLTVESRKRLSAIFFS